MDHLLPLRPQLVPRLVDHGGPLDLVGGDARVRGQLHHVGVGLPHGVIPRAGFDLQVHANAWGGDLDALSGEDDETSVSLLHLFSKKEITIFLV